MSDLFRQPPRRISLDWNQRRPATPGWRQRGTRLLLLFAQVLLGTTLGILVFDRLVMPRVVRQGDDVVVPRVVEVPVGEAITRLEEEGLRPIVEDGKFSPTIPSGLVLAASPDGGLRVKKGRQVFLTPSLGIESRAVPELAGMTLRLAQTKLRSLGLEVGEVHYAAVGDVADGEVLATAPGPGGTVPSDGKVEVLMSRRKAEVPVRMPDLSGRPGAETAAWLAACGFEARLEETSFPGDPGAIVRQDPAPGAAVYPGTGIVLEITKDVEDVGEEGLGWRERLQRRFSR